MEFNLKREGAVYRDFQGHAQVQGFSSRTHRTQRVVIFTAMIYFSER